MTDFEFFLHDGLDSNLIVFETFDHSSLIFFSAFFAKLMIFEKIGMEFPVPLLGIFSCVYLLKIVVYFVSWTNAKWKTQTKLQLWIDKIILEIDEKPIMLKKNNKYISVVRKQWTTLFVQINSSIFAVIFNHFHGSTEFTVLCIQSVTLLLLQINKTPFETKEIKQK